MVSAHSRQAAGIECKLYADIVAAYAGVTERAETP